MTMQPPSYTVDSNSAAKAGIPKNARIQTSGAYVGVITKAKSVQSQRTGAFGIEFDFKSDSGETSNMMTIWISKESGEVFEGFKAIVDAIAFCTKQRDYAPVMTRIKEYDFDARAEVEVQAWCYPALMNKPVGLILQAEEYAKGSGELATRMNIIGAFGAQSRKLPAELMEKDSKAEMLDKILANLKDKKLKNGGGNQQAGRPAQQNQPVFEDFDDSNIPF